MDDRKTKFAEKEDDDVITKMIKDDGRKVLDEYYEISEKLNDLNQRKTELEGLIRAYQLVAKHAKGMGQ